MGPGKMAQFSVEQAVALIRRRLQKDGKLENARTPEPSLQVNNIANDITGRHEENDEGTNPQGDEDDHFDDDPNQLRFACKRCRTVVFRESEFEDPPHSKAAHQFSFRKTRQGGGGRGGQASECHSYFLQPECRLMKSNSKDIDGGAYEGKLHCPKCAHKVGQWSWAGAQCSCGTWVTPVIQIPCSKVDIIDPAILQHGLPAGAVPYRGQDMV
jgi:dual specificity phosphatase 12